MSDTSSPESSGLKAPCFAAPPPQRWLNRYAHLSLEVQQQHGVALGTPLEGEPMPQPRWVAFNEDLAQSMACVGGASAGVASQESALDVLSGNALWPGMMPMATVYSGHQFGHWAGQLGDGRALLLGELETPIGPQEIQLKGAGETPYSRRGDGRAVLRSSIREYLCSEAMHGLGIPTTRALALTASPLSVRRESFETAAVVTRVAPSFIRFGHFEHFAHHAHPQHHAVLARLLDFVVEQHYPELSDAPHRALALLRAVVKRTANLMADWQSVGFCHGVMNTDNMSILGLTIDYGPFGFMDAFDPDHICNHSDDRGRYSWNNQPQIGYWNCRALAQALLPLIPEAKDDPKVVVEILESYEPAFTSAMMTRWSTKLGLYAAPIDPQADQNLAMQWLTLLARGRVDFTIAFRRLAAFRSDLPADANENAVVRDLFLDRAAFDAWASDYATRLKAEGSADAERAVRMDAVNPLYVLRNHMAETAIRAAQHGDDSEVRRVHQLLKQPFVAQEGCERYADFPPDWAQSIEVSCSS